MNNNFIIKDAAIQRHLPSSFQIANNNNNKKEKKSFNEETIYKKKMNNVSRQKIEGKTICPPMKLNFSNDLFHLTIPPKQPTQHRYKMELATEWKALRPFVA